MSTSRREFLGLALAASLGVSCRRQSSDTPSSSPKKRILILGGTGFLGPKTVEVALARGHEVTIFNRGKREKLLPFPYRNVTHLYGNRDPLLPADDERGPYKALLPNWATGAACDAPSVPGVDTLGNIVVLALDTGRFQPVEVVPGAEAGEMIEIRSGLKEGERVVVSGQFLIDSEANVRASFARMQPAEGGAPAPAAPAADHSQHQH